MPYTHRGNTAFPLTGMVGSGTSGGSSNFPTTAFPSAFPFPPPSLAAAAFAGALEEAGFFSAEVAAGFEFASSLPVSGFFLTC